MKGDKELLQELLDENKKGLLARELDLAYHKEVLEPRFVKEVSKAKKEDKAGRQARLNQNSGEMKNLEILIDDFKKIIKINERMIKEVK
jgi:hypothetical protein